MGYFIGSLIIIFIIAAVIKLNLSRESDVDKDKNIDPYLIGKYEFSDEFLNVDDVDYIDWDNYKDDLS